MSGIFLTSDPICTIFGCEMSTREQEPTMSADPRTQACERLERSWNTDERWRGIERRYSAEEVVGLRGSVEVEHSVARRGAAKLWQLVNGEGYVPALGAITGSQAVQMVKAGVNGISLSGWQVAGDRNLAESTYPGQSLYPV